MDSATAETVDPLSNRKEVQFDDATYEWMKLRAKALGLRPAVYIRSLVIKDLTETYGAGWRGHGD